MLMCRVHSRNMVKVTVNLFKIVANHRKRLELVLKKWTISNLKNL